MAVHFMWPSVSVCVCKQSCYYLTICDIAPLKTGNIECVIYATYFLTLHSMKKSKETGEKCDF